MKKTILTLVITMIATIAMAENKTVKLYIPSMECKNCQAKVENVLNYEKGVKKISVELEKRIVTIQYDDKKTSVKTLQDALLKELKFKSQEVKGDGQKQSSTHQCSHSCDHSGCGHNHDSEQKK